MSKCGSKHPWIDVYSTSEGCGVEIVVRWCPKCGGIVIDRDFDNRTNPGAIMKASFPGSAYEPLNEMEGVK
jgi:hypothetical protein